MKPFKLRSGNKPSIAKLSGVSPMRDMIKEEESKVPNSGFKLDQLDAFDSAPVEEKQEEKKQRGGSSFLRMMMD